MSEDPLEAEAIEEAALEGEEVAETRRLPARPGRREELEAWRGEVRIAAIAAAGGLVAGVITVVAVNAARALGSQRPRSRALRRGSKRERAVDVVASRSFLIDVHVLGR